MLYQMYLIITKPPDPPGHYQTGAIPTPVLLFAQTYVPGKGKTPLVFGKTTFVPPSAPPLTSGGALVFIYITPKDYPKPHLFCIM